MNPLSFGLRGDDVMFYPMSRQMVGYRICAFTCLDCGVITQYLNKKDRQKIREQQSR